MKYLFIVQGEGRGHLTQALSLEEMLIVNGHEVTKILVGKSNVRSLPKFFLNGVKSEIKQFYSPNFLPTSTNKQVHIGRSIAYNLTMLNEYWKSMLFIRENIQESDVDIVINFYELLTGFSYFLFNIKTPYICIGHQYLFLHKDFSILNISKSKLRTLNMFSKLTSLKCKKRLALSFYKMNEDLTNRITVVPPLLRKEVFQLQPSNENYILGYMVNSGYGEEIYKFHKSNPNIHLQFFWDKKDADTETKVDNNLSFHQINDHLFLKKMRNCQAYATTAGFESVCEAAYLGKPVLMVPVHIEQECNAADALRINAGIISSEFDIKKLYAYSQRYHPNKDFKCWAENAETHIIKELTTQDSRNIQPIFNTVATV